MSFLIALLLAWPIISALFFTTVVLLLLVTEHEFISTALVVAATALFVYIANSTGMEFSTTLLLELIAGYIVLGFVFTVPKWYFWAQKMGRKFKGEYTPRMIAQQERKLDDMLETKLDQANRYEQSAADAKAFGIKPDAAIIRAALIDANKANWLVLFESDWNCYYSKNVMKIRKAAEGSGLEWDVYYDKPNLVGYLTSWIINWPFYLVLLVLEDVIVEIVNWFADHIGNMFRGIATKAFNAA